MESCGAFGERESGFDARRVALVLAGLVCILVARQTLRTLRASARGGRDFRRLIRESLRESPCRGRSAPFFSTIVTTTFVIGFFAHVGERDASIAHDASGWLIVALFVGFVAAIVTRLVVRTLPDVVARFLARLVAIEPKRYIAQLAVDDVVRATRLRFLSPWRFGRPPPLHS